MLERSRATRAEGRYDRVLRLIDDIRRNGRKLDRKGREPYARGAPVVDVKLTPDQPFALASRTRVVIGPL
jgi:hypothetical protein